ncbi:Cd2+/Zn2+-exporting ATPase [Herbinix hemicellulosilytica]|uniref:Cd(2+)-exporting ATPase n=2 Tax=Herbinix hemicellulosilytica TaxID=1564487 RepID=A0A0H5SYG3_HERHM|nr:heavy metal translocating P-type ATPase [Herbinix hemicellulosilytica]RBP56410.1 Cd2+/Zn2+-exporting ATPase [Herbinix hemicellulosilytica]CRZ35433.1 Cadmium, zinc and cobalt-transporting ATPase [Herbinix hemicellulosilytica]
MKKRILRILFGALILVSAIITERYFRQIGVILYLVSYFLIGGDILFNAVRNILRGSVFDENFLMALATVGAMFISEYTEGIAVMLLYQIGEMFQDYAVDKSRKSIADLMNIRPDHANVKVDDTLVKKEPDEVKVGDIIVIKAGERVPLDAIVVEGTSLMDTSALTGESIPREVEPGDEILSGCINVNGLITARVTREYGESTVSKILDLVENASNKKSRSEKFITRFARYYTPTVVILAVLLAFVPPLIIKDATFGDWIYRALSFLVVSCPCALVISIPLTFFSGIGGASKKGILVKGSNYFEALANTEIVVFDKTGTLTKGVFGVKEVHAKEVSEEELIKLAAYAESYSNHPISQSILKAYGKEIDKKAITDVEEISGHGVIARVNGKKIAAGNAKLMKKLGIPYFDGELAGTVVHVAVDNIYAGYILIADDIKSDSAHAIKELKNSNIKQIIMLTGDSVNVGENVGKELGLSKVYAELLPADKVEKLEELLSQTSGKGSLAYVGDGINDAPVLARADVGIAMGGLGSDAAIEAADVVIMTDEPSKVPLAINIAKKVLGISNQNIVFALGVKVLILLLSALGVTNLWVAIFGDVGVAMLAILNSFRAMIIKNK